MEREEVARLVEYLRGAGGELPSDTWPASADDLLENIFSLEVDSLNLLEQPLPDLGLYSEPLTEPSFDAPGSSCSDSGLSSDHADLTDYDQQLSPFLIQNTCSDEARVDEYLSPQCTVNSPQYSESSPQHESSSQHSGSSPHYSESSPHHSERSPHYLENSPQYCDSSLQYSESSPQYSEDDIIVQDGGSSPQMVEEQVERVYKSSRRPSVQKVIYNDFQNSPIRKRRSSQNNTAVVQPKVHRTHIQPITVTSKPQLVVTPQKPLKVTNIQVINPQPRAVPNSQQRLVSNSQPRLVPNTQPRLAPKTQPRLAPNTQTRIVPNSHTRIVANSQSRIVSNSQTRVMSKPAESIQQRKVIRVAPMAGNPRSILLPVTFKDMKDLRSIKIINASDLKNVSNIKLAAANLLSHSKMQEAVNAEMEYDSNNATMDDSLSEQSDDDDWPAPPETIKKNGQTQYPRLMLSPEERKLLTKEGIKLPASYPLTKHEERELKRIRRKIRNKISAQDSRKRKKEYVDGLEDRVKQCAEENQTLIKRIKILQSQNQSLTAQLKRLQHVISGGSGGGKSAQPATCLLVLLMSVALVALPSLREAEQPGATEAGTPGAAGDSLALRRALLSATQNKALVDEVVLEEGEFNMEDFITFRPHSDHDYQLSGKSSTNQRRPNLPGGYLDIPIDEDWPPNLKRRIKEHFDFDNGQDYLPPIVKDENYFDTIIGRNTFADKEILMADHLIGSKLGDFPMIAVKTEDIITEEVNDSLEPRNATGVRSFVVNGTAAK